MVKKFVIYYVSEKYGEAAIAKIETTYEEIKLDVGFEYSFPRKVPKEATKLFEPEYKDKCLMIFGNKQKYIENDDSLWLDEAKNFTRLEKLKRIENE